jgi:uncharacterized repeat protein (TIGR01451 family)
MKIGGLFEGNAKSILVVALILAIVAMCGCLEQPDLRVKKDVQPKFGKLGTDLTYSYNITNYNTTHNATNITLQDDRFGNLTSLLPKVDLGPKESMILYFPHTINLTDMQNLVENIFMVNNVTVNGTIDEKEIPYSPHKSFAIVVTPPRIVSKTALNKSVMHGDEIYYNISIYNPTNTQNATNVTVTDVFDRPVYFVSADPMPDEGTNIWHFARIGPKEFQNITLVVRTPQYDAELYPPYVLHNCARLTSIENQSVEEVLKELLGPLYNESPDFLDYFQACDNVKVGPGEPFGPQPCGEWQCPYEYDRYNATLSFERLLIWQEELITEFGNLLQDQLNYTTCENLSLIESREELLRNQTCLHQMETQMKFNYTEIKWNFDDPTVQIEFMKSYWLLMDKEMELYEDFEDQIKATWCSENLSLCANNCSNMNSQMLVLASFEDLLYRQADLLADYALLLNNVNVDPNQIAEYKDLIKKFEALLKRQSGLLQSIAELMNSPCTGWSADNFQKIAVKLIPARGAPLQGCQGDCGG